MSEWEITSVEQLEGMFRSPSERAANKSDDRLSSVAAEFIARCPFVVIASGDGVSFDASPRGGRPGFVKVLDERTVAIPDRGGNNRLDTFRNVIEVPRVGLLFIVPGRDETLRINGPASLTTDPAVLARFDDASLDPKLALVVEAADVYGHCAKAFRRSALWDPDRIAAGHGAPDLPAMYAERWGHDAAEFRGVLTEMYSDELAAEGYE